MNIKSMFLVSACALPILCFGASAEDININYNNGVTGKVIKESPKGSLVHGKATTTNNKIDVKKGASKHAIEKTNKVAKFRNKAYINEVAKTTHWQDYQLRKWFKKHPKEALYNQKQYNFSKHTVQALKDLDKKYNYK